jgi:Zn-dependent M28 family amino/carboxypeptidase
MRFGGAAIAACLLASAASAQGAPDLEASGEHALLRQAADAVSADQLRATIQRLVLFGTRHTASDTRSNTHGIGAARRWAASQFEAIARACGGCLQIQTPSQSFTGERLPGPTEVMDVLAVQRGASDPDRVIIISGHLDSRNSDPKNFTRDAPGANDDGSGTAAVLEAARVLSQRRFAATLVYAVLSGEEEGLYGGKVLADYAHAQHWRVEADLNNDIIGNTEGMSGLRDDTHVRVFSEGTRATETQDEANRRRYNGGEVDSPSRNLARFIDGIAEHYLTNLEVEMIYRTDRFGRSGDQVRMVEAGYPAVRITEAVENYNRQHQDVRIENGVHYGDVVSGVDFRYLAQVARLNIVTLAALASAPAPPDAVGIAGNVSSDTTVSWNPAPGAAGYRVWWRLTTDPQWRWRRWAGDATQLKLADIVIDNYFFGVSAVSADGYESPIEFPGAAGAFFAPPPSPLSSPSGR